MQPLYTQKMKVVPLEKKFYGKFHVGDSYICLDVSTHTLIIVCS